MYLLVFTNLLKVATAPTVSNRFGSVRDLFSPHFFGLIDPAEGFKESHKSCRGLAFFAFFDLGIPEENDHLRTDILGYQVLANDQIHQKLWKKKSWIVLEYTLDLPPTQ